MVTNESTNIIREMVGDMKFKRGDRVVALANDRSGNTKTGDIHTIVDVCDNTGVLLIAYKSVVGWCYDNEVSRIFEEPIN